MHRSIISILVVGIAAPGWSQVLEATAVHGPPFGVGRVVVRLEPGVSAQLVESEGIAVTEADGRIYYPLVQVQRPGQVIAELLGAPRLGQTNRIAIDFLFQGSQPLKLRVETPRSRTIIVYPTSRPEQHRRMLRQWWRRYRSSAEMPGSDQDYPPLAQIYLSWMLHRRLQPVVRRDGLEFSSRQPAVWTELLGTESARVHALEDLLDLPIEATEPATLPLPPATPLADVDAADAANGVTVEDIAHHVPSDWFYIRFRRFSNYLWLKHLIAEHGGDLSRMVALRGHDTQLDEKIEEQLGLRESLLAQILGEQVISDVAIVGRDTFLRDGPAIGILFEARNELLASDLNRQRQAAVARHEDRGATMTTVSLAGQEVSFATSPDHTVRSFYARRGKYHLVTTSRAMAQQFLTIGSSTRALADDVAFRLSRRTFPVDREDDVFLYLSARFLAGLLSPEYQIEVDRRMRARAELDAMRMARWAAAAEREPASSIADLVDAGFLPAGFAERADGSRPVTRDGELVDSQRGAPGTFVPVADNVPQSANTYEIEDYRRRSDAWQRMLSGIDPLLVAIHRERGKANAPDRVDIQALLLPFHRDNYQMLTSLVDQPVEECVISSDRNLVFLQVAMRGTALAAGPYHLFFALRDEPWEGSFSSRSFLRTLQLVRTAPAYLGSWPKAGLLDRIPLGNPPVPDEHGLRRFPLGVWQLETPEGFSLVSFHPSVLQAAAPTLAVRADEQAAQLRAAVGDLATARMREGLESLMDQRAYAMSMANVRLMHMLARQFQLPRAEAHRRAEELLGVRLVCPLGGEYQLTDEQGLERWVSTAWPSGRETIQQHQASRPLFSWFRGLDARLVMHPDRLQVTAELRIVSE